MGRKQEPLIRAVEQCDAYCDPLDPVDHIRCRLEKGHDGEHTGIGKDGAGWYWYGDSGPVQGPVDIDLSYQQWHLFHAVLDGAMMSAGLMATPDGVKPYEICVDHVNEIKAEADNVLRLHSKILQIIRAIDSHQKVTVTVIPF